MFKEKVKVPLNRPAAYLVQHTPTPTDVSVVQLQSGVIDEAILVCHETLV